MKKLVLFVQIFWFTYFLNAQCDYKYFYSYKGNIINEIVNDTSELMILVPSDLTFINNKKKNIKQIYQDTIVVNKSSNKYYKEFTTIGPCYIDNYSEYLTNLFIENVKSYKIIIKSKTNIQEFFINVNNIKFILNNNRIEIELPEIKI